MISKMRKVVIMVTGTMEMETIRVDQVECDEDNV